MQRLAARVPEPITHLEKDGGQIVSASGQSANVVVIVIRLPHAVRRHVAQHHVHTSRGWRRETGGERVRRKSVVVVVVVE